MIIEYFIIFLLFTFSCLFHTFYQHIRCENIFKKMKWIISKSTKKPKYDDSYYGCENLTYYVNVNNDEYAAYKIKGMKIEKFPLVIPEEYQINFNSEQEKIFVSEILESFRRYEADCFFYENRVSLSSKNKAIYKLRDLDYYMYSLLVYLSGCTSWDSTLSKKDIIYDFIYENKPHSHYNLTEIGRVYYKLYLVVSMYCENNDYTKSLIVQSESYHIMEYLEKNEVVFWRYRP